MVEDGHEFPITLILFLLILRRGRWRAEGEGEGEGEGVDALEDGEGEGGCVEEVVSVALDFRRHFGFRREEVGGDGAECAR